MTFEERKAEAKELVVAFLGDYSPPRGLDASQQANRISHAADAFARRMPVGEGFAEKVEAVLVKIRDTHLSNSWPAQAAFVMAMPQTEFRRAAPKPFHPEGSDRNARLLSQGVAVAEVDVWRNQDVSAEVIDRYRYESVRNWQSIYRGEAQEMMARKYGGLVARYFMEAAE